MIKIGIFFSTFITVNNAIENNDGMEGKMIIKKVLRFNLP